MATPNYDINYDDKRFTEVESDKNAAIKESNNTYDSMIKNSDKYYQKQIDAANKYAETQKKNQQAQTDFAIEKIEQQKDQAHKDYIKEQSGAYTDWQKQSNQYGANAEQRAAMGMANTGYSESSQVSMYNTYQNRVTAAREAYTRAVLNYDNAIKDARLQNNSVLAEIAYNALQKQLELSLAGFQYKNQLILDKAAKKTELDQIYYSRYKDVLSQINTENAMAEEVRQYNETLAFQKDQAAKDNAYKQAQLALSREQFEWQKSKASSASGGSSGGSGGRITKKSSSSKKKTTSGGTGDHIANAVKTSNTNSLVNKAQNTAFLTYSSAASFLNKNGISTDDGGLMTKDEWSRRKTSGSSKAPAQYDDYRDYLKSYVIWKCQNPD